MGYKHPAGFQFQTPRSLFTSAFPTATPEVRVLEAHRLGHHELASCDWGCQLLLRTDESHFCTYMELADDFFCALSVQDTKGIAKSRAYKLRFELMARRCGLL
uniref:Uncharacterized protein n=1 Tax=Chromera velia CCMP2878 TaxID=1169474 RepID=A0A0G4HEL5_9ALVE|eukprot:Cvel_6556.t1-p1 / transcript=Cvel_6556.t1 / gene=Cvel_6556 / organism=Chromera_velia_CCMP2878 / gene_product=hypothetical protein / transcript_product=hypothetical protein / location=Cvel_scaffold323:9848-13712(+) / protein_length=102 / sequence_SO=supercontig / SO=protein_coding / is_pseudo=false